MPICPNKNTQQWKDLVASIKARDPKLSDTRAEAYASYVFFEKGDGSIPTPEEGASIIFKGKTKQLKSDVKEKISLFANMIGVDKAEIKKLNDRLAKGEIKQAEYEQRIKELKYEGRFKEAEARIAAEIEGKKAGRREGRVEERATQREFASRVSEYLKGLVGVGDLSSAQAAAISRRAAKVGTSERSYEKFTKYVDNVIENANYESEMNDIRSMQKAANKGKNALSTMIKEFTKVNPEDIPLNLLTKYKQALDGITGKVKNPGLMKEMYDDVMSIIESSKTKKEFNEVTTLQSAGVALDKIRENKLETIEDYEQAINDVNALKRKLNQLVEEDVITQDDYEKISEEIGFTQEEFESKNKDKVDKIKKVYVDEISSKKIEPKYDISEQERLLLENISEIKKDDMMNMSVYDLYMLNEAIDVANDSYVDVKTLQDALNSYEAIGSYKVAEQLNKLKESNVQTQELVRRLMLKDDVYWENVLGLPASKVGELYLRIITPFRKGVAQYVRTYNDGMSAMRTIEKNFKLSKEQHNKVGMIVHFLQEHMRQFDKKYQGLKDIGKRDEFSAKLFNKRYTDNIASPETVKMLQDVYSEIPKGADGKVNIEDVYNDFVNEGGKYLTKNEIEYVKRYFELTDSFITPRQEYANALRGKPFERIDFYMPREEYRTGKLPSAQAEVSRSGNITIKSPTGEERVARDIMQTDIPKTDFSFLMNKALKSTARDYHLTKMLQGLNKNLNEVYKNIDDNKKQYVDAIVQRMHEGLKAEINSKESDASIDRVDKILSASAMVSLGNPIRTFLQELPSGVVSYPIRSGTYAKGYAQMMKSGKIVKDLKIFTNSPLAIAENIQAKFDADSQEIKVPGILQRYVTWNSAFTERTINNAVWMPKFEDAFFDATGKKFSKTEFENNPQYRKDFKKEINDAGSVADQATQEIVGSTTAASARQTIDDILTTGTSKIRNVFTKTPIKQSLKKDSAWGKIVGYMGNYVYRDYVSSIKGFKEAKEGIQRADLKTTMTGLSKPFGVLVGTALYTYLGHVSFLLTQYITSYAAYLFSDELDEESINYAKERLMEATNPENALKELSQTGIQVMAGKYGADSRTITLAMGTAAYYASKDEETRTKIKKYVKELTFVDIPKLDKVSSGSYGKTSTAKEIAYVGAKSIATAATAMEALVNEAGGIEAAADLLEKISNGEDVGDKKSIAQALKFAFSTTQIMLIMFSGVSIPESRKIQTTIDKIIKKPTKKKGGKMGGGLKSGGFGKSGIKSGGF